MCELLGISSRNPFEINSYIEEFIKDSDDNPNGWGLALMHGNTVNYEKEPMQASKSHYLKSRLSVPIVADTAFCHIRYATIGNIEYRNCHPFVKEDAVGRRWTLIHNGTIFDYPPLDRYTKEQEGDTDSERILLYLVHELNHYEAKAGHLLSDRERFDFMDSEIVSMSKGNKLNLLLWDGEQMYVHTNYANSLYYSSYYSRGEQRTVFCTRPLSKGNWLPVPFMTLLAYQEGKPLYQGTTHENEYFDSEENTKYLYQIFSDL